MPSTKRSRPRSSHPERPGALAALLLALAACGPRVEPHPDWVIRAQVVFVAADLRTPVPAPAALRLQFPYICGDLYGAPSTGDFLQPALDAQGRFEIDLNRTHPGLLKSLEPADFSLPYLQVQPPDARFARLAPLAVQADGIEPVGRAQWLDAATGQPLLLLFFDRPALISGSTQASGRPLRYEIRAGAAGYVWVARQRREAEDVFAVVGRPSQLVLAVTPAAPDDTHK
ncbi:MAG TPA: hypothetical protein VLX90_05705 [Steroidobacteraceae bacterium]|nr:hypothetical protein [Steroidobacteraceae bacterium]